MRQVGADEDGVGDALAGEVGGMGANRLRHAAVSEVVVDNGDLHGGRVVGFEKKGRVGRVCEFLVFRVEGSTRDGKQANGRGASGWYAPRTERRCTSQQSRASPLWGGGAGVVADFSDEMEAPDFESEFVIESVRGAVCGQAVDDQDIAIVVAADLFESFEEQGSDAFGAEVRVDDEVIDFEIRSAPDFGAEPDTGDAYEFALTDGGPELVVRVLREDCFESLKNDFF